MSAETKSQTQQRIDAALRVVAQWGVGWSRSKVLRTVRRYEYQVEHNGWSLFDYLVNTAALTEQQRRATYQRAIDTDISGTHSTNGLCPDCHTRPPSATLPRCDECHRIHTNVIAGYDQ